MNIAVILSGGQGFRFDANRPKQYHVCRGKEIIHYVYEAVKHSALTDKLVIVSREPLEYEADYAQGGGTHNESVKNAIDHIAGSYPDCEKVVFLDSVRPFVTSNAIDRLYELLDDYDAITTAQHITDSLGKLGERFVDRSDYFLIQKPAAFRFEMLHAHFRADSECTAIIQQMPPSARRHNYFELRRNMKITYPEDLVIAKAIMDKQETDERSKFP